MPDPIVETEEQVVEEQTQDQAVETTEESAASEETVTPTEPEGGEAEAGAEGEASTSEEPHEGLQKGVRKRIDTLTRKKKEAEERAATLERENKELMRKTSGGLGKKPEPHEFDSTDDYTDALVDYKVKERTMANEQARTNDDNLRAEQDRREKVTREWNGRQIDARTKLKDYDEVTGDASLLMRDNYGATEAIIESEHGPQILYHLGRNPELAAEIGEMSPNAAAMAIGRLEAKLESATNKPRNVTQAPKPVTPVTGQDAGGTSVDPEKLDDKAYREYRERGGGGGIPQYKRK